MLSFYLQRGIIWIVLMVGMEGRSNREKLRKEAGATVLAARRTWFWMEAAASATLASARGQKRALYYRLYSVTQPFWALKIMWKNPFNFECLRIWIPSCLNHFCYESFHIWIQPSLQVFTCESLQIWILSGWNPFRFSSLNSFRFESFQIMDPFRFSSWDPFRF